MNHAWQLKNKVLIVKIVRCEQPAVPVVDGPKTRSGAMLEGDRQRVREWLE